MTDPSSPDPADSAEATRATPEQSETPEAPQRSEASRRSARRRIAEVFGEVLPETTSDERDPQRGPAMSEDWYRENRPPHHDR